MTNIYLFKSTPLNITNLLQFCFMLSCDDLYDPCAPTIVNNYLDVDIADFIKTVAPENSKSTFRNVDWSTKTSVLDEIVNNHRIMAIATNSTEQLYFIKKYLGNRVKTISTYCNDCDFLLTYFVHQHIYAQKMGLIQVTEHDQGLRDQGIDLVKYYKQVFAVQGLAPAQLDAVGEYNVPLTDYFEHKKFFKHIEKLGGKPTAKAVDYYNTWYNINKEFI